MDFEFKDKYGKELRRFSNIYSKHSTWKFNFFLPYVPDPL